MEALEQCRNKDIPVVCVTNNSTKSRGEFADKLTWLGHPTRAAQVINSAYATGRLLAERYGRGTAVYVVGAPALSQAIKDAGFVVTDEEAAVVVVGLDRSFTYDKLRTAVRLILAGADFVATNTDRLIPSGPDLDPGAGTLVAAVEEATGHVTAPVVVGKPEIMLMTLALQTLGVRRENTVVVGDQLSTDVQAGQRAGLYSVLITTGVPSGAPSSVVADRVIEDLRQVPLNSPVKPSGLSA